MEAADPTQNKKKNGGKCGLTLAILVVLFFSFIAFVFIYYNFIKQYPEENQASRVIERELRKQEASQQIPQAPQEKLTEYFTNVAFTNNDAETYKNIARSNLWKWDKKQIGIELSGDFDQNVSAFLDGFMADFNNISDSTKLIAAKNNGDIKVKFQSHESLAPLTIPEARSREIYAWTTTGSNCRMTLATVYMQSDIKSKIPLMKYTLGHELLHALGFTGHDTGGKYCNYMSPIPCGPIEGLTQYDEYAIKSAYSSGLKACESKAVVLKRLKESVPVR